MNNKSRSKSFSEWLSDQAYRNDVTGSFARRVIDSGNIPVSSEISDWYKYNEKNKIASIEVFNLIWEEYVSEIEKSE